MNYPVWDVAFGAGLLMALVSILHVFNNDVINYDLAVQWIHAKAPDLGGKKPGLIKNGK